MAYARYLNPRPEVAEHAHAGIEPGGSGTMKVSTKGRWTP